MNEEIVRESIKDLSPYIPGKQVEEVVKEFGVGKVIKLASNENPFGPSPKALEAVSKNALSSSVYPDQHHILLREEIAKKYGISKGSIIVGNGSDEIMLIAAETFLSAGEEILISRNTFSMYEFAGKIMDGRVKYVDLKDHTYDLDGFLAAIGSSTKMIFLCNPNNPTGTIFTKKQLEKFLNDVPERVIVVLDEAYGDYCDSPDYPKGFDLVKGGNNLIVLRTFSKIYGLAGLRIGYGVANEQVIKYMNMAKMPFNVNRLGQAAAAAALNDDDFKNMCIENNKIGKEYLYRELDGLGLKYLKTQANFIFIEFNKSADKIFLDLLKQGVIVRPLASFGFSNAIRVTVGTPDQNKIFINALKKAL